jgi:hypothetical protein
VGRHCHPAQLRGARSTLLSPRCGPRSAASCGASSSPMTRVKEN